MSQDLSKAAVLSTSIGHLLVVWDILSNKLAGTPFVDALSDEEKRAFWALEDLCERGLVEGGVTPLPEPEWNSLVETAREFMKTVHVEYMDTPNEENNGTKGA